MQWNQLDPVRRVLALAGVMVALALAGCGADTPAPPPEGMSMRLAPAQAGAAADAAPVASLWVPKTAGYELKEQESTAQLSRLLFVYKDKKGNEAAYLMVGIIYGEADQSLDEKFTSLVDEDKVAVKDVASYKPVGEPQNFTTEDGLPGQLRVFTFLDEKGQKQIHAFALLDLRKKDAVYARIKLTTLEGNFRVLDPQFQVFLKQLKRNGA